jgi:cysteine desulfurase
MLPYFGEEMGNAQSVHSFGQRAKSAIERARREVADLIVAAQGEIVFVSGGTEADNLAVRGIAEAHCTSGRHIITSQIEHPAVLATCEWLEQQGFEVTRLAVGLGGAVSPADVKKSITPETILVSVMHANNETGVIQPIEEIADVVREARKSTAPHVHFHTDAVQSVGKIPVGVDELGVDLLSLSAHKIHGPKGVGALYVRKGTRLGKLLYGGHHERDRRAGTENVPGIVGLGVAARLAKAELAERSARMRDLRDHLETEIKSRCPGAGVNGGSSRRLPNISNLTFEGLDGESLLIALDLKGVAVSTGSACSSGSLEPSHVLTAMGLSRGEVRGSLRFSLSARTTREEVDYAISAVQETVSHLRQLSPEDSLVPGVANRA